MNIFSRSEKKMMLSRAVLATLGLAGILSVALIAPNAVQAFKFLIPSHKRGESKQKWVSYRVNATVSRLQKEGFVKIEERGGQMFAGLTEKGKRRFEYFRLHSPSLKERKEWDHKWRIVVFDIKEEKRISRNKLRSELRNFGFVRLQQSVWVYPYDCEELIALLKTDERLWGSVLYVVAEKVEGEEKLKKVFDLSKPRLNFARCNRIYK